MVTPDQDIRFDIEQFVFVGKVITVRFDRHFYIRWMPNIHMMQLVEMQISYPRLLKHIRVIKIVKNQGDDQNITVGVNNPLYMVVFNLLRTFCVSPLHSSNPTSDHKSQFMGSCPMWFCIVWNIVGCGTPSLDTLNPELLPLKSFTIALVVPI